MDRIFTIIGKIILKRKVIYDKIVSYQGMGLYGYEYNFWKDKEKPINRLISEYSENYVQKWVCEGLNLAACESIP